MRSSAPCATTRILATSGSPDVTGAVRPLRGAQGNGAAVDVRGDVTRSEGVVWGPVGVALHDADPSRRRAPMLSKSTDDSPPDDGRAVVQPPGAPMLSIRHAFIQKALNAKGAALITNRRMVEAEGAPTDRPAAQAERRMVWLAIRPTALAGSDGQDGGRGNRRETTSIDPPDRSRRVHGHSRSRGRNPMARRGRDDGRRRRRPLQPEPIDLAENTAARRAAAEIARDPGGATSVPPMPGQTSNPVLRPGRGGHDDHS